MIREIVTITHLPENLLPPTRKLLLVPVLNLKEFENEANTENQAEGEPHEQENGEDEQENREDDHEEEEKEDDE